MSNSTSSRLVTDSIPKKIEDGRAGNSISKNFELPKLIEGTLLPYFPPEIVEEVKKHVKDHYKLSLREDEIISEKVFEDNVFRIEIAEKPCLAKTAKDPNRPPAGGFQIVTLSGLPDLVSLGRKRVNHFIQQGNAWRRLLNVTELDEKSRYDIRVRVPQATCPLESQIKIYELDEYYINLNKTTGVLLSDLEIGTELHYILGDITDGEGFVLLKIDGVTVQCLADIKVVCTEATSMGNDSVEVTFRFPVGIDLSKIRGEFVIERSSAITESKESNEGSTSPPPPSESDDPLSAYSLFATKFKEVPIIEFPGLCVVSVTSSMWNRHKSIYGPVCDSECPCASTLNDLCDTVRSDILSNFKVPTKDSDGLERHLGFLDYFYKKCYSNIENEFSTLRPHEIYDKVIALWRYHRVYGVTCSESCPCLNAWQSYFKKQLMLFQQKKYTARSNQAKNHPIIRKTAKYSMPHDPNPSASDVAARARSKTLKDVIMKKMDKKDPVEVKTKRKVKFKEIEGDLGAPIPRGCVTQIDNTPVSSTTADGHDEDDSIYDKYSMLSFFSRRENSDHWNETKEKKIAMRATHAWKEIEDLRFACSKCKVSKGKFLSCCLCGSCLNCGSKFKCDAPDTEHLKKGRLSTYDLTHLFRRRYELALLATFGFSVAKTVSLRDLSDRTVEKDADIFKVRNDGISYYQDFSRAMELIDLAPGFINQALSLSTIEELVEGDIAKEFAGRTILFAAVMHSTHDTVLYLLKQGSDPRHRDVMNKRASDVVKERRDKLINRMKDIWNGEGKSMLDEEETIKADIKDVEITSKLLQVYMTGERLVNLSSGVKCWKLVQVRVLQAHTLCLSGQVFASNAPNLLFCAATWDNRQLSHISTVEPLSQNCDFSKSHPFQFRFNDVVTATYKGKRLIVQLIKGDPNSRDNFLLSSWESTGEELNGIADYKAISGTFPLRSTPCLDSGYLSVEIQLLPYDSQYEEKVKVTQSNELSGLISLIESLRSENIDLPSNLYIPTANNLSLLHAAIYLENADIVKRLLSLGARPSSDLPGLSPLELSKSLNLKNPSKSSEEVLYALDSFVISAQPPAAIFTDTVVSLLDAADVCSIKGTKEVETSVSNSQIVAISGAAGECNNKAENTFLPALPESDWMLSRVLKTERCLHFEKGHCDLGSLCPRAHVHCSAPSTSYNPPKNDELYYAYLNQFDIKLKMADFYMLTETGSDGNTYHTGALVCPVSKVIYYAQGGEGHMNENGIYWYRSKRDARVAVSSVVLRAIEGYGKQNIDHSEDHFSEPLSKGGLVKGDTPHEQVDGMDVKGLHTVVASSTRTTDSLPTISNVEWMLDYVRKKDICRYFNTSKGCDKKSRCYFAHIYYPHVDTQLEQCSLSIEKLSRTYDEFFNVNLKIESFYERSLPGEGENIWFLGGFVCPVENTIYYAQDGVNGHLNKQRIFLYPSPDDARAAVAGVVLNAFRNRGMTVKFESSEKRCHYVTSGDADKSNIKDPVESAEELKVGNPLNASFGTNTKMDVDSMVPLESLTKSSVYPTCLPLLSKTEWMLKYPKARPCNIFPRNNACPHGRLCSYAHVYNGYSTQPATAVSKQALSLVYEQKFQFKFLADSQFNTKEEKSSDGIAWFTAAFICPVQEIIYLAAGCEHGFCSSQGIFWYSTINAAIGAAAAVAVQALNEYSDFLPIIPNAHWMLDSLGAKHNCRYFSSVEGCCPKGLHCIFAHHYVPKSKVPSAVPESSSALWDFYNANFGISLKSSSFYEKCAEDKKGDVWYTGALLCPIEKTIYYAEGGKGWKLSEQNIFWYTSMKEARAAVSTVVLMAYSARGYKCNFESILCSVKKLSNLSLESSGSIDRGNNLCDIEPVENEDHVKKHCMREEEISNISQAEVDTESSLPLMKKVDWMLKHPKARQCFAFERDYNCLLGKNCGYGHVYRLKTLPPSDKLIKHHQLLNLYKDVFGVYLKETDILRRREFDANGRPWVTGCLVCPIEQTVYAAAGGKHGYRNSQGIYFYPSVEEMLDALAGVVFHVFSERKEVLPWLPEAEWMLEAIRTPQVCKYFPGCGRMNKCHFAHIYRGKDPDPSQAIENDSLLKLYKHKFQKTLKNSDFYEKVCFDKMGRQLYTGALRCPVDRTLYYARGMGGIASTQNVFWYSSRKAARTAVAAVVLSALGVEDVGGIQRHPGSGVITSSEPMDKDDILLPRATQYRTTLSSKSNTSLDSNLLLDSEFSPEEHPVDDGDRVLSGVLHSDVAINSESESPSDSHLIVDSKCPALKEFTCSIISPCDPCHDTGVLLPEAPKCEMAIGSECDVSLVSSSTESSSQSIPKRPTAVYISSFEAIDDGDILLHKPPQCGIERTSESVASSSSNPQVQTVLLSTLHATCDNHDGTDEANSKAGHCESINRKSTSSKLKRIQEMDLMVNKGCKRIRLNESLTTNNESIVLESQTTTTVHQELPSRDSICGNWMEENFTARCRIYTRYNKCPRGKCCSNAHVYIPTCAMIKNPPEIIGLSKAYKLIFQSRLHLPHIKYKRSLDAAGKTWFTAGFWCQVENVFYYAADCPDGFKAPRTNVYWYPDEESANFALRAVLFTSFVERRFISNQSSPSPFNSTISGRFGINSGIHTTQKEQAAAE